MAIKTYSDTDESCLAVSEPDWTTDAEPQFDPDVMTREEFAYLFKQSYRQVLLARQGKIKLKTLDEVLNEL